MKHEKKKEQAAGTGKKIQVQLYRSVICTPRWMRTIVSTMGLRKMNSKKVFNDNPAIRGMVAKVPHLVKLTEL